jgi:hypothetical protein
MLKVLVERFEIAPIGDSADADIAAIQGVSQ